MTSMGAPLGALVDEEAVGGAAFALVEAAESAVLWEAVEERVLADEVPVAHPGRAEVADGAVVGEGSGGGEFFGDAVGECVGLRDGEEWRAGADGVEDAGLQVAERDDLGLFAGLGCVAGLHGWCGFEAGGLADVPSACVCEVMPEEMMRS